MNHLDTCQITDKPQPFIAVTHVFNNLFINFRTVHGKSKKSNLKAIIMIIMIIMSIIIINLSPFKLCWSI